MLNDLMQNLTNEGLEDKIEELESRLERAMKLVQQQSDLLKDANEIIAGHKAQIEMMGKIYESLLDKVVGKL